MSIWVVPSSAITGVGPEREGRTVRTGGDKIYRHPTFYTLARRSQPHVTPAP
ncbi:hypothetical protein [Burkholderia cenocepacia]|uniref:hypothetical protein n=1 Tax=Burkholderia cenocepacia TaxID=95486 RepID=UPI003F4A6DDB